LIKSAGASRPDRWAARSCCGNEVPRAHLSGLHVFGYTMGMEIDQPTPELSQEPRPIIVYGRPGCPGVGPVLRLLDAAGATYDYVDIRQDPDAAARLRVITGGHEGVPTVVLPDGRALVEPGTLRLRQALQEQSPAGEEVVSSAEAVRAGLSNPIYLVLALIALGLIIAVWVSG